MTVPSIAESNIGKFKSFGPRIIKPNISRVAGIKHIKIAGLPTFFKSFISNARPARVKIITSAICLSSDDMPIILESNKLSM